MAAVTSAVVLAGAAVYGAVDANRRSKVKPPAPPPAADASEVVKKEQRARRRSSEAFIARQQLQGPVQLQVPGIRF